MHVVRHVELTCMHALYCAHCADEPVSRLHAGPQLPVLASHRQPESAEQSALCLAKVSMHDGMQPAVEPPQRHALTVEHAVCVDSWLHWYTQLPYWFSVHDDAEAQLVCALHAVSHVVDTAMHAGLRVHVVACEPVAPSVLTWLHCVKHLRRDVSHWQRESLLHDAMDGYATLHCSVQLPLDATSHTGDAAHVASVPTLEHASWHVALCVSHRHSASLAQPTRSGCSTAHDDWHAPMPLPVPLLTPALYWHRPLAEQLASSV